MVVKKATQTEATDTPKVASKFQLEESLPSYTRTSTLDPELLEALKVSYDNAQTFSMSPSDLGKVTRKGVTRDATTEDAEAHIRRHVASTSYGVSVRTENGRVLFQAKDRRVVPTGADRKPRTKKV